MNKDQFNPLVSIIIPVYNGSDYMREAIDSALEQTYKNIEVIVVNDGSQDDGKTDAIAKLYGARIRYFSKENGGVATALNLGISKMKGEYFSWLSHDDIYKKDKIAHQIEALNRCDNKDLILAGGIDIIDEKGQFAYTINPLNKYDKSKLTYGVFALMRGCINGCTLLIPKRCFENVGAFDASLITTQDYDLFFRLFFEYKLEFVDAVDVLSRSHANQGSKKMLSFHIQECNELWKKMIESLSDKAMCELDGSTCDFLINTQKYLKENTSYIETIEYLDCKIIEKIEQEFDVDKLLAGGYLSKYMQANNLDTSISEEIMFQISKVEKNKNIVFLLGDINDRYGINRVVINIANTLSEVLNVMVISSNKNINGYKLNDSVNNIVINYDIYGNAALMTLIMKLLKASVVIINYNCVKRFLEYYKIFSRNKLKTIAWNHEYYFLPYDNISLQNCIEERNNDLSFANAVVWLNKSSLNIYSLFNNNGFLIPNIIPIEKSENNRKVQNNILLAVGRFDDDRKGLTEILEAFSLVLKKRSDAVLKIVGQYDLSKKAPRVADDLTYGELIGRLKIPKVNLRFCGQTDDVGKYYKDSAVNIVASYNEGFGLVIVEAAEYGVPTVVFSGSAGEDIIASGNNGYVVEYGNVEMMADKICNILNMDSKEYHLLSSNVRRVSECYSSEKIIPQWLALIKRIEETDSPVFNKDNGMSPSHKAFFGMVARRYEQSIKRLLKDKVENNSDGSNRQEIICLENEIRSLNTRIIQLGEQISLMQKTKGWILLEKIRGVKKLFLTSKLFFRSSLKGEKRKKK